MLRRLSGLGSLRGFARAHLTASLRSLVRVPVVMLVLGACAHPLRPRPALPSTSAKGAAEYRFSLDASLASLEARVCFAGAAPAALVSGSERGAERLLAAWVETPAGRRALGHRGRRIELAAVGTAACVGYTVDLGPRARRSFELGVEQASGAIVVNTALLLWRPSPPERFGPLTARFALPNGVAASVPWPEQAGAYLLEPSAFAFYAFAVFGRFEALQVSAPSARLDVSLLAGLPPATRANVVPWLERAARAAALAFGRFPRAHAQVIVVPVEPASEPVRFGTMNRGGGASALLLLPKNAELEPLLRDWVALHEFCHLFHPFVQREDAWFSEGLATYYEEVLRARAGMESKESAWRRLFEGSELAHYAERSLAEESAHMFEGFAFKQVYWAGAAFALLADVELRRASRGQRSLDTVMAALSASAAKQSAPLRASQVLSQMDEIAGSSIFTELSRRYVEGPSPPDLAALYRELGVEIAADGVRFRADAPDAAIRDAIMPPASDTVLAASPP